jgi:hypothetical protein
MSLPFPAAMFAAVYVALLCGTPALALWMLIVRLRRVKPGMRRAYLLLGVIAALFLLFNLVVSAGMTGVLTGTVALLFAWLSAGICVLLALTVRPRRRTSLF